MNDNKTEADLPTERYFTVVYKLTDANTAKYLSNRDWVSCVYADSMAELDASRKAESQVQSKLDLDAAIDAARAAQKGDRVKNVLAIIGGTFLVCSIVGTLVPDAAYHVYFGTADGAREWHQKHAQPTKEQPHEPR